MALNPKQQRFVAEYLIDLNAGAAAIRAGYSRKSAETNGPRMLRNAQIQSAVAEAQAKQLEKSDLSATRVLEEYRRVAFTDIRQFFDEHGNIKPMQKLTADQGAALAGFEVLIKNAKAGDGVTDTVHKFRLWDKIRALDSLAKHFGLLTDQVEHFGDVTFRWLSPEK